MGWLTDPYFDPREEEVYIAQQIAEEREYEAHMQQEYERQMEDEYFHSLEVEEYESYAPSD